ncbi:MAG: biotin/lipoyl-containing protein [Bacteroidales bacterium]|jgi:biotin carboxyl carrier protein|nr:acetyl-CoA carboxylase biotin carboxyl carrier protein subunit [Bacteroidales bacterium]NCU34466.1 acetyl-CoA carboxylase biotin carboxyl carrier protein subunit [Candidatus Falkowbacteria bacterium]MDD2631133.1 acetyl-CoA carboxylase biotin carboxyl carrier protein subunit [Bacteroidales bacterium]MDD3132560.1 acetyl-CoA carboxylase biotin carboxyl carrier protein subunit [Bacteroidales bacterium]MDD4175480.1 acetyl-CoA carboxylase biotin carboxyl carrier protein subunit [Bacteroidales bact
MKKFKFKIKGHDYDVQILKFDEDIAHIDVNGTIYDVEVQRTYKQPKTPRLVRQEVQARRQDSKIKKTITKTAGHDVKIPLPGNIMQVFVKNGDEVKLGDKLVMYEAMKMENVIVAEKDGVIQNLTVQPGDTVLQDAKIMEIA